MSYNKKNRSKKNLPERFYENQPSPTGGVRGCLCEDNTYHVDCCDGSLRGQGIGEG